MKNIAFLICAGLIAIGIVSLKKDTSIQTINVDRPLNDIHLRGIQSKESQSNNCIVVNISIPGKYKMCTRKDGADLTREI